ncbi:16S rRNA (uracil(1498)-N(3))-methyltransferase [Campylobacter suis]|uniref:Ribosomal RNA small subunit methyltransferase E n=1 Tax=Campylobacter suis TaxID=2790657 RepID=A0ABN7KBY3_9BACT|nr:16S rRNA (uracil(1498)-N(3))-methyltransferase [Campylobacter suis]CAD7288652.1 hypothetical protein LMG8286_01425 [Campylobacter suis]
MKFLFEPDAGKELLELVNEPFLHLKARRLQAGQRLELRNLKDKKAYLYEIISFGRRSATLELIFSSINETKTYPLALAWAVVDPKIIEKTLPFLSELGVGKIIFVYTKFSQANFKLDVERFERICALSCEQSGRESLIEFEIFKTLDDFLKTYKDVALVNFGGKSFENYKNELLFIGPEGGFSADEVAKFSSSYAPMSKDILRSQTAIVATAAKLAF